jgi:hypothetical protein
LLAPLATLDAADLPPKKPDLLGALADAMGAGDPQCFNLQPKIATPYIDRLTAEWMKFTKAHTRAYQENRFESLGLGEIIMGNAGSEGAFTAMELAIVEQGLGLHQVRHRRPGSPTISLEPRGQLLGENTFSRSSLFGCILVADPDPQLVIVHVRKQFHETAIKSIARVFSRSLRRP